MFGFVLGAVCVVAAVKLMRRGYASYHGYHGGRFRGPFGGSFGGPLAGYGGGCGAFGYRDGHDRDDWFGPGGSDERSWSRSSPRARRPGFDGRRRWFLRGLFERLETTPGQEKAILAALDRLRDERRQVFDEVRESRSAVARVIESGLVDDAALEETFARHDRLLARVRVSLVEAMKTVAEALDERQRKELASLIAGGRLGSPFGSRFGGGGTLWA